MVQGLASHAERRLIISFAPDTWRVGAGTLLLTPLDPRSFKRGRQEQDAYSRKDAAGTFPR